MIEDEAELLSKASLDTQRFRQNGPAPDGNGKEMQEKAHGNDTPGAAALHRQSLYQNQ